MAALADPQSGKCSCIDPLSFFFSSKTEKLDFYDQNIAFYHKILISTPVFPWKSTFSFGAFFDLFLEDLVLPPLGEDGDDDGGGGGGRIFPEHPSPILHAPRDNISRKGKSL